VDVSADGENNAGVEPEVAYESPLFEDVTVNALIVDRVRAKALQPQEIRLVAWFEAHVLHGPRAFSVLAEEFLDYERAMAAKLVQELEVPVVGGWPVAEDGA
jgi:hypothetical protein